MYVLRNFLGFLLGAAAATAWILLMFPAPCPCVVRSVEKLALSNGTQEDPGMKHDMAHHAHTEVTSSEDLPQLLRRAAMEDKTVIMTLINDAWAAPGSLLDVFLESFRNGDQIDHLLNHLVIVAVDATAFDQCKKLHPLCYLLTVDGANFTSEQPFMTKDYLEMMWARNKFQTHILEMGYNILFTDVDIIWFRNPFLRISVGADITISSDQFYGDLYDVWKNANGGFLYAKSSNRTIDFFRNWYEARKMYPGKHEQYIFDMIKYDFSFKCNVKIQFVDTAYVGGFCQPKKDFRQLCTFHANCLVGLATKLSELKSLLGEWRQYKAIQTKGGQETNTTLAS